MNEHRVDLQLTILLESPLHIGTGYGHAGFLDAVMVTDVRGYPYVPGSSLKGRLRHYARTLAPVLLPSETQEQALTALFGSPAQEGTLVFEHCSVTKAWIDLIQPAFASASSPTMARLNSPFVSRKQTNVMLSRMRGVAMEQRLFTVESAPPHLAFSGRIHGRIGPQDATTPNGRPQSLCLLVAAIQACTHLGGRKSRGLACCRLQIDQLFLNGAKVEDAVSLLEELE